MKEVSSGKALSYDDLVAAAESTMDARSHVYCWSWVVAVIAMKGDPLPRLFKAMKDGRIDTARALKSALGMSPDEFMQAWRKHARR